MGGVKPDPHRFRFVEEIVKNLDGALNRLEGGLEGLRRGVAVEALVELQAFGEALEGHAHERRQFLSIDAPAGFIVQFGEDHLKAPHAAQEHLNFLLHDGDLAL